MPTPAFVERQNLIQSPNTLATVLHAIMRDKFGEEWYGWDLLTVGLELQSEFQCEPCPAALDRIAAVQTFMTGDSFFNRIDSFIGVCNSLSSGQPFFGAFDPVTTEEAAWGVAEVGMNRDMLPFSPTIRKYCRIMLREDGYGDSGTPPVFDAVFDGPAGLENVTEGLAAEGNGAALNAFLASQASDMAAQFDALGDVSGFDGLTLSAGLDRAFAKRSMG